MTKKQIIFNDPIYGFITVPDPLILKIINHSYFLRLQRIRQLGLTNLVYTGALHTRFQHAMGAMHLTMNAVETLRSKDVEITNFSQSQNQITVSVIKKIVVKLVNLVSFLTKILSVFLKWKSKMN